MVIPPMQGLRILYEATGRRAAWRRLVDDAVPDWVDPASDGPLAGREDHWSLVTDHRVRLAREEINWAEAERLQRVNVDWNRQRAQPALAVTPDRRDAEQRIAIRVLGITLQALAPIQREQGSPTCAATFREALDLANASGDTVTQAACAFNLGRVYQDIADLRNLDEAERWYRKSLDLYAPDDRLGRGLCVGQLGQVAYARFRDARTAKRPVEELLHHIAEAARLYEQALDMMPTTAVTERGTIHNQLGIIYRIAGDIDRALRHHQQCIRYREQAGDIFRAGQARGNVAMTLSDAGRLPDARAYAEAALANFRTFGDRAADAVRRTERIITAIDQAIAKKAGGT
jgi:tetratricopeptide (TPR) repeat protein